MSSPVAAAIGTVFVPVSDIAAARDWYCGLLGLSPGEILFGHLYVVPMRDGSGLALDSKGFVRPHDGKPLFHFNTSQLAEAREHVVRQGARDVGPVTDGVYFTFKDPDGNLLMVADVPPAPRS